VNNISGFGLGITILASNTYPVGIQITQYSDDSDPLDIPGLQIADSAMGLNGDLIVWSKANPIKATVSVIPQSDNDKDLSILLSSNRPGKGKAPVRDVISMVIGYPDGNFVLLSNGVITDGTPLSPVASSGRLKTRTYSFTFESYVGV
jgi:hypothetical protein